jgi:hypothetical protein
MLWNDTTNRLGAVQEMEDICGLGATGITGNTALFQQFTRWANKWAKIGIKIALNAQDGFDVDDPNWTTYPSGTYTGTTNRDYVFSSTEQMLKIKKVGATYDGTNYVEVLPIDTNDQDYFNVKADPNIDSTFNSSFGARYDPKANGFDLYPKFTQAQVNAGAKVYVEFYREPKVYATTGTDSYIVWFENLVTKGASYEYACLYKPDLAQSLRSDLYGNNANIKGIVKDMEEEFSFRYPQNKRIIPIRRNPR